MTAVAHLSSQAKVDIDMSVVVQAAQMQVQSAHAAPPVCPMT